MAIVKKQEGYRKMRVKCDKEKDFEGELIILFEKEIYFKEEKDRQY